MSPAYREPDWDEPSARRLDWITERPIPPSGNPLLDLPTQHALAYLGVAFGLRPADLAKSLRISRETLYKSLRRARAVIEPAAEPKLGRRCIVCGGTRPAGRVRCDECLQSRAMKAAVGRKGAAHRWAGGHGCADGPRA